MQIAILGRQSKISLAELESLYGAEKITPISDYAAAVDSDQPIPQSRIGGTIKSARLLTRLEHTDLNQAFLDLQALILNRLPELPEGKLQLGLSLYGFKTQKNWLLKKMLEMKKTIKKQGRSVRIIENKSEQLQTVQVLYNKLTGPLGMEVLIIKQGSGMVLAQTTAVQDIDAYAARDYDRPKRDTYVGMLPPKLAQIMLSLAVGKTSLAETRSKVCILDPFCGTGVTLQEALLSGYIARGSDSSEKMVAYTKTNLQWLVSKFDVINPAFKIEQADATTYQWDISSIQDQAAKIYIVCETYLGKPLTALPNTKKLEEIIKEANDIAEKFLQNIAPQLQKGTRLCLALPAWHLGKGTFKYLPALDRIASLGYNRLDLVHANKTDLIYHRENQTVARELIILEKV